MSTTPIQLGRPSHDLDLRYSSIKLLTRCLATRRTSSLRCCFYNYSAKLSPQLKAPLQHNHSAYMYLTSLTTPAAPLPVIATREGWTVSGLTRGVRGAMYDESSRSGSQRRNGTKFRTPTSMNNFCSKYNITYGHRQLKTGHPVRSAIHKQLTG